MHNICLGSGYQESQGCRTTKERKVVVSHSLLRLFRIYRSYYYWLAAIKTFFARVEEGVSYLSLHMPAQEYDMHDMHHPLKFDQYCVKLDYGIAECSQVYVMNAITVTEVWVSERRLRTLSTLAALEGRSKATVKSPFSYE